VIGVAIASFLLLLVVAYPIARPFFAPGDGHDAEASQLNEDRARVLSQIRDLDMEFETGKLSEEEYRTLRARRLREAEEAERALVQIAASRGGSEPHPAAELVQVSGNGSGPAAEDDLERAIAARKRAMQEHVCPRCGAVFDPDDLFCRRCGAELTRAQTR
jgi:ribosomal protein L40E